MALATIAQSLVVMLMAALPPALVPVNPGAAVVTELLKLSAPTTSGWNIVEKNQTRVSFGRLGFGNHGTLTAMAASFRLEPPRSRAEFLEQIQRAVDADAAIDRRLRAIESSLRYEDDRGYPCARYVAVFEDTGALVEADRRQPLLLQMHSLYCVNPYFDGAAFVAEYSHRGEELYNGLDAEARRFIQSVIPRQRTGL